LLLNIFLWTTYHLLDHECEVLTTFFIYFQGAILIGPSSIFWNMGHAPNRRTSLDPSCKMETNIYHLLKQQCLSICVGSAWKILPVTARSPEITHLNTLNRATWSLLALGGVHQNLDMEFWRTWFSGREISVLGLHSVGFQDPNLEILEYGFQDMFSGLGFSGLGISTLGPGFSHSRFPRPKPEIF
jgi:hypothetical protein